MEKRITVERMQEILEKVFGKESIQRIGFWQYGEDKVEFRIIKDIVCERDYFVKITPYMLGTSFFEGIWEFVGWGKYIKISPNDITEAMEEDFILILKEICDEMSKMELMKNRLDEKIIGLRENPTEEIRDYRLKDIL